MRHQSRLRLLQGGRSSEGLTVMTASLGLSVLELALSQCRDLMRLQLEAIAHISQLTVNVQVTSLDAIVGVQSGALRGFSTYLRIISSGTDRTSGSSLRLVFSDGR